MINLDFSQVQGFDPVPKGDYVVRISKAEETTAQSSGNPMINLTYDVIDGEHEDRKIFDRMVLVPKALWRLKNLLVALGADKDELGASMEFDPQELVGQVFTAKVDITEYEGNERNEVKGFAAAPEEFLV